MRRKVTRCSMGAILSIAAFWAWIPGAVPDGYGLHACPHHGPLETPDTPAHEGQRDHQAENPSPLPTCAWLADCEACTEVPPDGTGSTVPVRDNGPTGSVVSPSLLTLPLGPRHDLYELHLPNAPPVTA